MNIFTTSEQPTMKKIYSKFLIWTHLDKIKDSSLLFKRGFKNASFIGGGNIISQLMGLVGLIFIARLFGPEDYGIYTTVMTFVTFFHLFLFGGLHKVLVREGSKKIEAFYKILESTSGFRLATILLSLILCIGATLFTNYSDTLKLFIIIYSTEVIHTGIDSFISSIYQATEEMQYMAYFTVSTRFLVTGFSIAFLYLGGGILTILIVNLICKFAVLIIKFLHTRKLIKFNFNFNLNLKSLYSPLLKATLIFSLLSFINTLAIKLDILMISFLSTSTDVGIYAIAYQISKEGLMLRNVMATAFFPIAVKFLTQNEVKMRTLLSYSFLMFFIVLAGCVLLFFFAQDIVILVFGTQYAQSGYILKFLIFYLAFSFFTLPLTTYLQSSHNEHILLIVYVVTALTNIPLNIILFYQFGLIGIAYSTLIVFLAQAILVAFLTNKKMRAV